MRHILYYIGALALAIIPYSSVLGKTITHNFNDMYMASPKRLVLASGNTSATTADDFTYTCGGTATSKFGMDLHHVSPYQVISVNLESEGDYVVVTSEADALGYVSLFFYSKDLTYEK